MISHHSGHALSVAQFYTCAMSLRIRQMRQDRGWTQEELAARARMSRSHIAMIENETRPANTLRLNSIAAAFGVRPEELFDGGDDAAKLVQLLRHLDESDQQIVSQMIRSLAAKQAQD